MEAKKHEYSTDLLRLLGAFAVVLLHCAAQFPQSRGALLLGSLSRFCVPLFVMVSGSYLRRSAPSALAKKLGRLALIYLFWSVLYALEGGFSLRAVALGPVHFWYLWMYAGLLLFSPLLVIFCENAPKPLLFYAIGLCFFLGSLMTTLLVFFPDGLLAEIALRFKLPLALCFPAYFLAGYAITKFPPSKKTRALLGALGLLGAAAGFFGSWNLLQAGEGDFPLLSFYAPNVALYSVGLFCCLRPALSALHFSPVLTRWLRALGEATFGVYLIHLLILPHILPFFKGFSPFFCVILTAFSVFLLSLLPVLALRRVPLLRRLF